MLKLDTTGAPARSTGNAPDDCKSAAPSWGEIDFRFVDVERAVALAGDTLGSKRALLDAADRFYLLIRAGEIRFQTAIDGLLDIGRANNLLTSLIEEEIGRRLRGEIDPGWRVAAIEYRANRGPERSHARRIVAGGSEESDRAWDEFDRLGREHNARERLPQPAPGPTRQVTVRAILVAVRERGLAALQEPNMQERLACCDDAALAQLAERISAMAEGANAV